MMLLYIFCCIYVVDAMSSGLTRLRGLAMGLGDEMDKQNEQLDRIDPKLERANVLLKDQNRQMGQILKK